MKSILDVEFLLAPRLPPRVLVYRMRTGLLRHEMERALRDLFEQEGRELYPCRPSMVGLASGGQALFDGVYLCDLSRETEQDLTPVVKALRDRETSYLAVFAPHGSRLFADKTWLGADGILLVEEPIVTSDDIPDAVWQFVVANCDLLPTATPVPKIVKERFTDQLGGGRLALPSLVQAFDAYVAQSFDQRSKEFVETTEQQEEVKERSLLADPLLDYLADPTLRDRANVLRGVDLRVRRGRSYESLIDDLHQLSANIALKICSGRAVSVDRFDFVLWIALLVAWTPSLRSVATEGHDGAIHPNEFLQIVDQLLRDFATRQTSDGRDRLAGVWDRIGDVSRAPRDDDQDELGLEQCLVELLGRQGTYEPEWVVRLRAIFCLDETQLLAASPTPSGSGHDEGRFSARLFDEIVGRDAAVAAVKERFGAARHTPLFIYGPDGVGKKTFARAYARAFMCTGRAEADYLSCGRCGVCMAFDNGVLGYVELDGAAHGSSLDSVRGWLRDMKYFRAFAERNAVILENPERAGGLIDTLLKTLEERHKATLFIACGREINSLRATGVSRSEVHRFARLSNADAESLVARFCSHYGQRLLPGPVLDLVLEKGGGLPRRLAEACANVCGGTVITAEDAGKVLGFGWIGGVIATWTSLLGATWTEPSTLISDHEGASLGVADQMRATLTHIAPGNVGREPALPSWRRHSRALTHLADEMAKRAASTGQSYDSLWGRLSAFWCLDHVDLVGQRQAFMETRRILRGNTQWAA
ncbi:hypothetical protein EJ069_15720 [Mesorhizobium sp. M2A.F.Ca.ET.043.05.1.1]|uniref:hypothetical protein n=1 Tax=Mesorhizobium sp. M2A.F.Ca.ET.043.05.1.1 TaxID=2493671 RepID=UPI000F76150B|nr:hypothetical protein [Mesorhizobium sp. M2A.F.Ca.ET.043.05.1.1]AZO16038.1 hypothetical protein EJ069_15720 [Mesorhizobium sp. M2A.F.Ca.ET.043.05.1.1]